MDDKPLLSHYQPTLQLRQHVAQVKAAADFLLAGHSTRTRQRRPETLPTLEAVVRGHDLGKGSPAFQLYIRNPSQYRGDSHAKEHSALSAALATLWAKVQGWNPLSILALVQIIAGHHAGFATLDYLENRLRLEEEDLLLEQWDGLDRNALEQATGLMLTGTDGAFEDARRWLFRRQRIEERLYALPLAEAIAFRLWTQFLLSLLLEADKAFLALREEKLRRYFQQPRPVLDPKCVDERLAALPDTPLNNLRNQLRERIAVGTDHAQPCCTLTLPTGTGKTLLAATWALRRRQAAEGSPPRIIIALPFLSIIDQTEAEYRQLLGLPAISKAQSSQLLASHSLSQREYELEGESLGSAYTRFYLDTWRSEIIVTTFDQLLLALFSPQPRHQMRFHALMDALIILDEIQTLPCQLWDVVDQALRGLTMEGNTQVLLMSATQPALLTGASELAGDVENIAEIFAAFRRYQLIFQHHQPQNLDDFLVALLPRLLDWLREKKRALITLNTRTSAKAVWETIVEHIPNIPVWLISADVTPRDRMVKITAIKSNEPCIVVSTQTIEAGVDIDMDIVIRDFAPLDALIQVAGRCNRNNRQGMHGGHVEIISLHNERGREYAAMIYDPVLLDVTRETLENIPEETIGEEAVLTLSQRYFELIKARKNTGANLTEAFARWGATPDIHSLLRGKTEQIAFLVLEQDEDTLHDRLQAVLTVSDRWGRREALRALAGEIQQRTVSVHARRGFHPEDYAELLGPFWILRPGYYCFESGLDLGLDEEDPATCIF